MNYKLLGKNIAHARKENNLTQEQLAEKVDVSTVFISQIETAVRKPSLETIYKLSLALNTTIDILIGNESRVSKYNEIVNLVKDKNPEELRFITRIIREISTGLHNGKVIKKD